MILNELKLHEIVIIICVLGVFWKCNNIQDKIKSNTPPVATPPPAPPVQAPAYSTPSKFDVAITKSSYMKTDQNNDGLIDCIDSALTFKYWYPEAEIMYVMSYDRKSAHLYIQVEGRRVEPQSPSGSSLLIGGPYDFSTAHSVTVANVHANRWSVQ